MIAGWEHYHWGSVIAAMNFFCSGLPGGIDYLMLAMIKIGKLDKKKHKKHQALLNVWLRTPGIIANVTICLFESLRHWDTSPMGGKIIPVACAFLIGFNGLYYMERVVASAGAKTDFKGSC